MYSIFENKRCLNKTRIGSLVSNYSGSRIKRWIKEMDMSPHCSWSLARVEVDTAVVCGRYRRMYRHIHTYIIYKYAQNAKFIIEIGGKYIQKQSPNRVPTFHHHVTLYVTFMWYPKKKRIWTEIWIPWF